MKGKEELCGSVALWFVSEHSLLTLTNYHHYVCLKGKAEPAEPFIDSLVPGSSASGGLDHKPCKESACHRDPKHLQGLLVPVAARADLS